MTLGRERQVLEQASLEKPEQCRDEQFCSSPVVIQGLALCIQCEWSVVDRVLDPDGICPVLSGVISDRSKHK